MIDSSKICYSHPATSRHTSTWGHKRPQRAKNGQKGLFRCFCITFVFRNIEITVFKPKRATQTSQNESASRKHPATSRHTSTWGHKWPQRAKNGPKGPFRCFCITFVIRNIEITVFKPKRATQTTQNESASRKHPVTSRHTSTWGHKRPQRAKNGQKGLFRCFCTTFVIKNRKTLNQPHRGQFQYFSKV